MKKKFYPEIAILLALVMVLSCGNLKAQTYRILPLGNSITEGMGAEYIAESQRISYRSKLFDLLSGGGYTFDYVGHRNAGYALLPDADHGGIPGTRGQYVNRMLQDGYDERWGVQITPAGTPYLDVFPADIILLHIGTNDITHGEGSSANDIEQILNTIDAWEASSGTHVVVFIARIINRTDSPALNNTTIAYNDNVASLIASRGDPSVILVNIESGSGINYNTELMPDGIHPAQSAYDKMGSKWYSSLNAYLSSIPVSPSGLSASGASGTSIQLSWNDNSNNEAGFEIERSSTANPGSFALIHTSGAGVTSYTDNGLEENIQYHYRVRAVNSAGPSLYTSIQSASTLSGSLAAPGGLKVVSANETAIGLTWSDNSNGESGFVVERSESTGSGFEAIHTTLANQTSYMDNGLADGTAYFYRVLATNGAVNSSYSNEAQATTKLAVPSDLSAGAISEESIHLFWSDNSVSESAYVIERSENSGSGYTEIHSTTANVTSYTDTGLADGKAYFYRIRASKGALYSVYSAVSNAFTDLAPPTGLRATSLDESTIRLEWADNSANESAYMVERSEDEGTSYKVVGVVAQNINTFRDNGLVNGDQFVYRVRATNGSIYSAYSNEASARSNLGAPTGLVANPVDASRIRIQWIDASYSETAYRIERSETPGSGFTEVHSTSANETFYEDAGLADGREYFYRVRASNESVNSEYSDEASATTYLATPTGLAANTTDEYSISLSWSDNSLSETSYIIERSENSGTGYSSIWTTFENTETYLDQDLQDGKEYFYRVRANNEGINSAYSNEAAATIDLAAPTGLTAISVDEGTVDLAWQDHSVSETGYIVERSNYKGTGYTEIHLTSANTSVFKDMGINVGDQYYYRVRATNGNLYSAYSNEAQSARSVPLSDSLFSFYPNPSDGHFTVVIRRNDEDISESYIRLTDLSGRSHYFEEIDMSDGSLIKVVEIQLPATLKNGIYSLTLLTGTRSVSEKFILVR